MTLIAPFIFAVIFMILVTFSSFIFKIILKIKSFTGFSSGVCCSILTSITASFHIALVIFVIMRPFRIKEASNSTSYSININQYFNYTKLGLFILWVFSVALMAIVFVFIFVYTQRVSKPEDDYNSIFMFVSGYIFFPALNFYIAWMVLVDTVNQFMDLYIGNGTKEAETARALEEGGSFIYTLVDFVGLLVILLFTGTIIMCMLHHRRVNPIIMKINIFCFFAPAISFLIFLYTLKTFYITYLLMFTSIVSFCFAIYFYRKYSVRKAPIDEYIQPQATYQLTS